MGFSPLEHKLEPDHRAPLLIPSRPPLLSKLLGRGPSKIGPPLLPWAPFPLRTPVCPEPKPDSMPCPAPPAPGPLGPPLHVLLPFPPPGVPSCLADTCLLAFLGLTEVLLPPGSPPVLLSPLLHPHMPGFGARYQLPQ